LIREFSEAFQGRVVVISPHLDDAVLSLGASIAAATRAGADVKVLTVFAGDERSLLQPGLWDRKSGFVTEGDAASKRREEDRQACAILGAVPAWLGFGDEQYARRGDEHAVWSAVVAEIKDADSALIPGFPLENPDHAWLTRTLLAKGLPCRRVSLYAEQPYLYTSRVQLPPAGSESVAGAASAVWVRQQAQAADRRAKRAATRAYRSQLSQLGLRKLGGWSLYRFLWSEARSGGESIARVT
jgi:LmbE family N-acetylglucosaminyl deacetylase